jgi:2-deoxy-D-gluconate 3-dehydrogenase
MLESRGGVSGEEAKPEGAADSNPRGRGKIINVASLVSFQGGLTVPAYAAAKHGVLGLVSFGLIRTLLISGTRSLQ